MELARERLALLERRAELVEGLPYLYGWKHYEWSRAYVESENRENFLVAANQIGKSSANIRKCIDWATDESKWSRLWDPRVGRPNQFWYLYPTKDLATAEFKTKWMQFLPGGVFKDHPIYGWEANFEQKKIVSVRFNTGVVVYFKTYAQNVQDLQAGSCYAIFCDEELPVELLPELQARLNGTDGYFHLVFTATLGQEYWRRVMECRGQANELHPDAFKLSVSVYDCLKFEDGSPSHWTMEKIERAKAKCPTRSEVERRIFGRFVVGDGLIYGSFDHGRNVQEDVRIPPGWVIYSGVDIGSGGVRGHPSAVVFLAVSPDYKQGLAFDGWRGDGIETTHSDVVVKWRELRGGRAMVSSVYDYASRDFFNVATRMGESFRPAEKGLELGQGIVNTLLRHRMLRIAGGHSELEKLIVELTSLRKDTPKRNAKDDFCDALRYVCCEVPWDFSAVDENIDFELRMGKELEVRPAVVLTPLERLDKEREEARRGLFRGNRVSGIDEEFMELEDALYG